MVKIWQSRFIFISLLVPVFIFLCAGYQFMLGFHNMDLSFNADGWGATHDRVSLTDTVSLADLWITGSNQIMTSFWLMFLGCMTLISWTYLYMEDKYGKN